MEVKGYLKGRQSSHCLSSMIGRGHAFVGWTLRGATESLAAMVVDVAVDGGEGDGRLPQDGIGGLRRHEGVLGSVCLFFRASSGCMAMSIDVYSCLVCAERAGNIFAAVKAPRHGPFPPEPNTSFPRQRSFAWGSLNLKFRINFNICRSLKTSR